MNQQINIPQRLLDYINIKKYYQIHKITPSIPVETVLFITQEDLNLINAYFNIIPTLSPNQRVYPEHTNKRQLIKCREYKHPIHNPNISNTNKVDNLAQCNKIFYDEKSQLNYNKNFHKIKQSNRNVCKNNMSEIPHTTKSYGYDQPSDLYFDYVDEDFQKPYHVDMYFPRGGESSRMQNKINRKQYDEIMY